MSHFYGEVINYRARTKRTRRGFKESGMSAYVQGWNVGVNVRIRHVNGKDICYVYRYGGAKDLEGTLICAVTEEGML